MATLDEQFAALPEATAPSLDAEFAALPEVQDARRQPTTEELAAERAKVEAEYSQQYLREHPLRAAGAAFAQQFAKTTLPFVGEALIKRAPFGPGLTREQQEEIAAASPLSSMAGTATGIVGAIGSAFATGGASAEAQLAGRAAATAAQAAGASRAAQALAAARGTLMAPARLGEAAVPLMSAGSRLAGAAEAAITTAAPALRTGIVGRTVSGAVGGGISAGAIGAINEAIESQIENRELSGENIVSQMKLGTALGAKIGGAVGAVESLAPAARWVANTETGRRLAAQLGRSRAERIYKQHAPDVLSKVQKQISPEESHRLINEAADQGLVGAFKDPVEQMNAVREAKAKSGQLIGRISAEADAVRNGAPVDVSKMWDAITDRVIAPMSERAGSDNERAAQQLSGELQRLRNLYGDEMTLSQLARARSEIDDVVFGSRPLQIEDPYRTAFYNGFRQFRHAMTDRIGQGVQEAGIDTATWRAAQRQYQVVSHAERVALKGIGSLARSSGIDKGVTIDNLLSLATIAAKGVAPGLGLKLAFSGLRYAAPRATDWARSASERALRSGATPPAMIADLRQLAEEQRGLAEGKILSLSLRPEDNARTEFLGAYDRVGSALGAMNRDPRKFPAFYADALRQAQNEMQAVYSGRAPGSAPSVDELGDALERARNVFSTASQPSTGAAEAVDMTRSFARTQQPATDVMRGLRDEFTGLLADSTGMWGVARRDKAMDELRALYESHADPTRLARLQAIQDEAHRVQREIVSRADRLMGTVGSAPRIKPKPRKAVAAPPVTAPVIESEIEPAPTAEELGEMGIEVLP